MRMPGQPLSRRQWLALAAAGSAAAMLAGCGFQLRGAVRLPVERVYLNNFDTRSAMARAIELALPAPAHAVSNPLQAQVVVQALQDELERSVVTKTTYGEVRELRLRQLLRLQLVRPDGRVLTRPVLIERTRDMSYTESAALAKQTEETMLVTALRDDIAQQVVQILAAVDLAELNAPPPPVPAAAASAG